MNLLQPVVRLAVGSYYDTVLKTHESIWILRKTGSSITHPHRIQQIRSSSPSGFYLQYSRLSTDPYIGL